MKFKILHLKMNFLLLIIYIFSHLCTSKRYNEPDKKKGISDINVLLPVCESSNCNRVSYEIEAYGGCFEWKLDKAEFIDLDLLNQPNEPQDCFAKVRISPKNVYNTDSVVFLQAKDKNSNELYRCRIGFGKIKKIKIIKRFDVINVGEIVELDVKGFDEKDNAFSSLEGFRFEWKISRNDLVEIIKSDQIKKLGNRRAEIEKKSQSDIVNLKGINTGKITLVAELIEESLRGLKTKQRNLYIIQPFKIFPEEPLYILNNNNFPFDLTFQQQFLQNQELEDKDNINSESTKKSCLNGDRDCHASSLLRFVEKKNRKFYNWEVSNSSCGRVEGFGYFTSISKNCDTKIVAIDNRIDAFNKEQNSVYVVQPTSLELGLYKLNPKDLSRISRNKSSDKELSIENISIDENILLEHDQFLTNTNSYKFISDWKLVTGNFYLIKNFLMYERHPIYFNSDKIEFNIYFEEFKGYLKEVKCLKKKKLCLIYATKSNFYDSNQAQKDEINLQDKLLESKVPYSDLSENQITEYLVAKRVQIFNKLKIKNYNQKKFYLPYLGFINTTNSKSEIENVLLEQDLHLRVVGGSHKYRYFSSNRDVIEIRDGVIFGRNKGSAIVTVNDDEIENTFDTIEIEVKEIKDLNYLEERQEILVEKSFIVSPVAGFEIGITKNLHEQPFIFTNCTNLNLEPNISFKNRNIQRLDLNALLHDSSFGKYYLENFNLNLPSNIQAHLSESQLKTEFLAKNKRLIDLKLKSLDLNKNSADSKVLEYIEYLKYANFGVCKLFAYKSVQEGMVEMGFSAVIENNERKVEKIFSSSISRINVYKPLSLASPIISDSFTLELISRSSFSFENRISNSFILAPGSGVNIKLTGGVDKWSEYFNDYQENQIVGDSKNNFTASIDSFKNKFSFRGREKEFFYECQRASSHSGYDNNDYGIEIIIQNKQDKTLINPAKTSISLIIGCQKPKSLSLFFLGLGFSNYIFDSKLSDKLSENKLSNRTSLSNINLNLFNNKEYDDVFLVPQKDKIKYFEQKASFDGLRIYSFDENKRMIYNYTSYKGHLEFKRINDLYEKDDSKLIKIYSEKDFNYLVDVFKQFNVKENIQSRPEALKDFVINLDELKRIMRLEKSSQNQEYVYQSIYFHNLIQKLELTYKLTNGVSQSALVEVIDIPTFSPNNSTLYLMENNFIFLDILYGSGDFEFTVNKNELAVYEYSQIDRKVKITALKNGVFTISIKDRKIGIEHKSVAIVYISPIKSIELIGGGLLMLNDTAQVEMKVYNIYDQVFPIEEVKKMHLFIDKSSFNSNGIIIRSGEVDYSQNLDDLSQLPLVTSFDIDSTINSDENDSTNIHVTKYFYIKGLKADFYSISVIKEFDFSKDKLEVNLNKAENSNIIRSNYVKIEVFKRLEIYPSYLLMVPGSQYTLSIKGGPSNEKIIVKKFEIIDENIASVATNEPQVRAFKIGQTVLKITISIKDEASTYNDINLKKENKTKEMILATQNVVVRVAFPTSVDIIGAYNRKIYTKSTIRLFAALKLGTDTFTYAYGPIKFNWLVDNSVIANLKYYQKETCSGYSSNTDSNLIKTCKIDKENSHLNKYYNSIGAFLKTYKQGTSVVKLNVEINYPEPYKNHKPNTFEHSEKIIIDDNIFVDIAEFYDKDPNKSGLYLIPFNVDHDLVTNKNKNELKYTLVSQHCKSNDPLVNLKDNGRITTYDRRGLAYVMIEKKEIDNKPFMPLVLPIYVVEFYSIFVERSYQTIDTEIGQSLTLKVLLQHEYGLLFAEKFERLELRAEISNPNVAQIELLDNNSKIRIHGNSKGQANIILIDPETKKILDVFNLQVNPSIILPERIILNVGAEIDFLKKDEEKRESITRDSEWIVDDPNIFKFDEKSGKGIALREGRTRVHLVSKDLRKEKFGTEIIVSRIRRVNVDFTLLPKYFTDITTDSSYRNEYKIPLKFYVDHNMEELSKDSEDDINVIDQKINVKCVSKQPEIFLAEVRDESLIKSTEVLDTYSHNINKFCSVTIRKIPFDIEIPQNLLLNIIIDSPASLKQDKYIYESLIKIPFTSSFRIKEFSQQLTILKENRTHILEINNANDIEIQVSNPSQLLVHHTREGEKNLIRFFVPNTVRDNFKDNVVTLTNRITGQKTDIKVNFGEPELTGGYLNIFSREYFVDFVTLLIIIVIIYVLVVHNFSNQNNGVEDRPIPPKVNPPSYQNRYSSSNLNFNKKTSSNY